MMLKGVDEFMVIELINRDAGRLVRQPSGFLQPGIVYPPTTADVYRDIKRVQKLFYSGKGQIWNPIHLGFYSKALVDRIYFARDLFKIQPRLIESVTNFLISLKSASAFENLSRFSSRNP